MMFKYKIYKDDKHIITYDCPIKVLAYEIAVTYGGMEHQKALKYTNLAYQVYIKDDNDAPIGKLFDYIVDNYDEIIEKNLTRSNILSGFYAN